MKRCALLMALCLYSSFAASEPAPVLTGKPANTDGNQSITEHNSAKPGANSQATPPAAVKENPPASHTEITTDEEKKEKQQKALIDERLARSTEDLANYTLALFLATALLAFLTLGLLWLAYRQISFDRGESKTQRRYTEDALKLTQDQMRLQHPPKLKIHNITCEPDGDVTRRPSFRPGERITFTVNVTNFGRQQAFYENSRCIAFWHTGILPMARPYMRDDQPRFDEPEAMHGPTLDLEPGAIFVWTGHTLVPSSPAGGESLYIMGYIRYRDAVHPHRYLIFARKYDRASDRFVPVDDPDYEANDFS